MSQFPIRVRWMVAAVAMATILAQLAEAQRDGGRRGRFGRGGWGAASLVDLAANRQVQAALKLPDDQSQQVEQIAEQLRDDRRELWQQGDGDFRAMREKMEKLNHEASKEMATVLNEEQQNRLMGILIQVNGASAVLEPSIAAKLNVSDEQKEKLLEVRRDTMRDMRDARDELRDLSRDERRAKEREMRDQADKSFHAQTQVPLIELAGTADVRYVERDVVEAGRLKRGSLNAPGRWRLAGVASCRG